VDLRVFFCKDLSQNAILEFCLLVFSLRTMAPLTLSFAFTLVTAVLLSRSSVAEVPTARHPQTLFLKEILMGRCYFQPPTLQGDPDKCPLIVGGLVGVFEGENDKDITVGYYEPYFRIADFSSPENSGLFVIGVSIGPIPGFVRPQDTLGGALMDGLTFCGVDSRDACPFDEQRRRKLNEQEEQAQQAAQQQQQQAQQEQPEQTQQAAMLQQQQAQQEEQAQQQSEQKDMVRNDWTGAQACFWARVYEAFASNLHGRVRVLVHTNSSSRGLYESLFFNAALPNLDADRISGLDIFLASNEKGTSCDNDDTVLDLTSALKEQGIESVTCTKDPYMLHLLICTGDHSYDSHMCGTAEEAVPDAMLRKSNASEAKLPPQKTEAKHDSPLAFFFVGLLFLPLVVIGFFARTLNFKGYQPVPEPTIEPSQ
jgi:hypothetical protein